MPIIQQKWIKRQDLRSNPDKVYVFGDNLRRVGYGGQAREMRGEPNALGIPTKASPVEYLDDTKHYQQFAIRLGQHFADLATALINGRTIVIPADGIGTGLAEMQTRAPICWYLLQAHFATLHALDIKLNESSN